MRYLGSGRIGVNETNSNDKKSKTLTPVQQVSFTSPGTFISVAEGQMI